MDDLRGDPVEVKVLISAEKLKQYQLLAEVVKSEYGEKHLEFLATEYAKYRGRYARH